MSDFSQAMDLLPDAVIWFDEDANLIEINSTGAKMWGYTKKELKQMTVFDINPNMNEANWQAHWNDKVMQSSTFESSHRRANGETFPVEIMDHFVNIGERKISCAVVRDISKRKAMERQLRLSNFTIENAGDAVLWLNREGNIKKVNQEYLDRYAYTCEEATKMTIFQLSHAVSEEEFSKIWNQIKEEQQVVFENLHVCKSGKKIEVEISANYIEFEDQELACCFVRDIRERKRKEAALRGALMEIKHLKEKLEAENNYLQEEIKVENNFGEIISQSAAFKPLLKQIGQVGPTMSTVLITGESGTGKELIARAVHRLSPRSGRAMIKVNCAALPANLIESELFGHEKGAFTGALQRKIGKFELAHEGTLFLDEIGEMPIDLQAKILRALQEGEIERVGGQGHQVVDVRIIAATNRHLEKEVEKGKFREDLFYRLNVFPLHSPPLRDRIDDIPILVKYFTEKLGKKLGRSITDVPQKLIDKLMAYHFPGNIRELENLVERAIITSSGKKLSLGTWFSPKAAKRKVVDFVSMEEMQRQHIIKVLQHTDWKVSGSSGAAEILKMRPTTLYSKIDKLGIKRSNDVR